MATQRFRFLTASTPLVMMALHSSPARAQTAEGFAVNRFEPAERGSEWFVTDNLDFRGDGLTAMGVIVDWSREPLVFRADDGTTTELIDNQVYAHLGASFVFWQRLRLSTSLPVVMHQTGESVVYEGETYAAPQRTAVGDLRLAADVRILGSYREPFSLAAGVRAWMPTGDRAAYAGDDALRLGGHVLGAGELGMFVYAARLGVNYRGLESSFGDSSTGTEFVFSASAGVRLLDGALVLGPELFGSTVLVDGAAFSSEATPVELLLGGHYTLDRWRFGLGVGPGLSQGFGSPAFRGILSAEYVLGPEVQYEDGDRDGIEDARDACPNEVGIRNDVPCKNGCPEQALGVVDRDGDGIGDDEDACPGSVGTASSDPARNGCPPPPDADGDGIEDERDACPGAAGTASPDAAKNGCPVAVDADGDGILDAEDACRTEAGAPSSVPSEHGCPRAKVTGTKLELDHTVEFELGSAELTAGGEQLLGDVARVIKTLPSDAKVRVEGHTDNKGWPEKNRKLSEARAQSVVAWLETKGGIAPGRLTAAGFGDAQPVASNDTDEGRRANRRVEFQIEGGSASIADDKEGN